MCCVSRVTKLTIEPRVVCHVTRHQVCLPGSLKPFFGCGMATGVSCFEEAGDVHWKYCLDNADWAHNEIAPWKLTTWNTICGGVITITQQFPVEPEPEHGFCLCVLCVPRHNWGCSRDKSSSACDIYTHIFHLQCSVPIFSFQRVFLTMHASAC